MNRLTARQREIIQLLAEGASTDDVCRRLFLARNTVKTHIAKAIDAYAATGRTHLVYLALKAGELT